MRTAPASPDEELIRIARDLIEQRGDDENHTVAAAAWATNGRTAAAVNVVHFTDGPYAELVVLGLAAFTGLGLVSRGVRARNWLCVRHG